VLESPVGALASHGWSDRVLALFNTLDDRTLQPGRVVRVERASCVVVGVDGVERLAHAPVLPAVGDWVALHVEDNPGSDPTLVVREVLPRWSALTRLDPGGATVQVLAANLDLVLVTVPGDRLRAARVERELAVAWDSGAQPLVVLTKADLASPDAVAALEARLVGVDVVVTSAATGLGVERVREALQPNRTAVLLGPSGAGKSTLANALLGSDLLATGAVRASDQRGRHITTSRQLVALPTGGVLIDTPGVRSLGLAGDGEGLELVFSDIEELAAACRFGDCRHDTEPGCAVTAAVEAGELDRDRFASYRKLQRELAAEDRRSDPVLRKAELSVWKARAREARAISRRKSR
jgi:ribosome biogenesis GTPase